MIQCFVYPALSPLTSISNDLHFPKCPSTYRKPTDLASMETVALHPSLPSSPLDVEIVFYISPSPCLIVVHWLYDSMDLYT